MRSMSRVERFFERLVERPSARLFRTRLQPIQVLRRIERAMEAGRVRHDGHDSAPNVFEVRLSPTDLMALGRLDTVAADLASGALAFARSKKLVLIDRPRVSIRRSTWIGWRRVRKSRALGRSTSRSKKRSTRDID
ncbi:MAG TPA: FhaA domain-containing protein, partial [Candidatus Limnocylindrales bacterium]|nr:FhaA domain-containing protein [Candidatus Limnocylindrales bacterium]